MVENTRLMTQNGKSQKFSLAMADSLCRMKAERKRQPQRIETMNDFQKIDNLMSIANIAKEAFNTTDRIVCRVVRDDNRVFDNFFFESFKTSKKDNTHTLVLYSKTQGFKSIKLSRIKSVEKIGRFAYLV